MKTINYLISLVERRRNLILYGPPGTGKTFTAKEFATSYLSKQLTSSTNLKYFHQELVEGLECYAVIGIGMYMERDKGWQKKRLHWISQILQIPLVSSYLNTNKIRDQRFKIETTLKVHASRKNGNINYIHKQEPICLKEPTMAIGLSLKKG
jgi:Cdc6-like AAA superfamily ATPase